MKEKKTGRCDKIISDIPALLAKQNRIKCLTAQHGTALLFLPSTGMLEDAPHCLVFTLVAHMRSLNAFQLCCPATIYKRLIGIIFTMLKLYGTCTSMTGIKLVSTLLT